MNLSLLSARMSRRLTTWLRKVPAVRLMQTCHTRHPCQRLCPSHVLCAHLTMFMPQVPSTASCRARGRCGSFSLHFHLDLACFLSGKIRHPVHPIISLINWMNSSTHTVAPLSAGYSGKVWPPDDLGIHQCTKSFTFVATSTLVCLTSQARLNILLSCRCSPQA